MPDGWASQIAPGVVFATPDMSFAGGLVVQRQPEGMELSNLLARLNVENVTPARDDALIPGSLRQYEAEGWQIRGSHGLLMVILVRAPDGRAFGLYALSQAVALARNQQLFQSVAWSLQIRKGPRDR